MENFNKFIFGCYPYLTLLTLIIGCITRYEYSQYGWKTDSSQLLRKQGLVLASNLFHIGMIYLFCGHLIGLLTPSSLYSHFINSATKQSIAMITGGFMGICAFLGSTFLLYRRFFDPRIRITSSLSDILILFILYIQLILGLLSIIISARHPDGQGMIALAHWAQGILTFNAQASDFITNEHWIFKVHVFLGLSIFLFFPFTRLVHILSIPVQYLFRTGYQIVRMRQ